MFVSHLIPVLCITSYAVYFILNIWHNVKNFKFFSSSESKSSQFQSNHMVVGGLVAKLCLTLVTTWAVGQQAPLSLGFSRQEYRNELPLPSPGDLPNPGFEIASFTPPALTGRFFVCLFLSFFNNSTTWETCQNMCPTIISPSFKTYI